MNESGHVKGVVRRSRKRDAVLGDPDLGKIPDRDIARRHGVSHSTAWKARKLAGIPCSNPRRDWAEHILAQPDLGIVIDKAIARRLGCADTTVCKVRNDAGIDPVYPTYSPRFRGVSNKEQRETNDLMRLWR